jgi:cyclophilin family peptidyl-prolyl cis-trans isomerase/HEAT repeat protein
MKHTLRRPHVATAVVGALALAAGVVSRADARRQDPGPLTLERLELVVDRVMAHRHYPSVPPDPSAPTPWEDPDRQLMGEALGVPDPAIRAYAVRALGRFEDSNQVGRLVRFLRDSSSDVRVEAGHAIAMSLRRASPVDARPVMEALLARVADGADAEPWMYDTLGRLPYARPDADRVESVLVAAAERPTGGAVAEEALVNLFTRDRARPAASATRAFLESRARGTNRAVPSLQAWRALQVINAQNADLMAFGAAYHCAASPECGWQIRKIAIDLGDPHEPRMTQALVTARHDESTAVRLSALRRQAKVAAETQSCAPLIGAITDASGTSTLRLEAMALVNAQCAERDELGRRLSSVADRLGLDTSADWHEPARALEALAKIDEPATRRLLPVAQKHAIWQVRAAAARAAITLKDEALLVDLTHDAEPNVATEAVRGLAAQGSPQTTAVAMTALASRDYQLVREAAEALKKLRPVDAEVAPLVSALMRLTAEGKDTSRDPRTSILNRLRTLAQQKDAGGTSWLAATGPRSLTPLLRDFDPEIARLAAGVLGAITGTEPPIRPTERPPEQPTEEQLRHEPDAATIALDNGDTIRLTLLPKEAPIAVARFAILARAGYYDNLTFHRVEPLFVVQGGSPGANEYAGAERFLRDEIGLEHHTTGAVGLSTRGRDTGDGQIFIDLTDQYRLDDTYTVFARVSDMGPVDRILEGARIVRVAFPRPGS